MDKEICSTDIIDQGHPPDVERLLLALDINFKFLEFLEQREKREKEMKKDDSN